MKPKINWEIQDEKAALLDELVKDATALIDYANNMDKIPEDLKELIDLLDKAAHHDININKDGKAEMVKGTANDRVISVNDPEMGRQLPIDPTVIKQR